MRKVDDKGNSVFKHDRFLAIAVAVMKNNQMKEIIVTDTIQIQ